MLSRDVRFEGFTEVDWSRVLSLFAPQKATGGARDPERPRGGVVAVHGEGRLRKLVHTRAGRLRLDDIASDWPLMPDDLAKRTDASWSMVLELGALERVMEKFGARVKRTDDLTEQALLLVSLVRDELVAGKIRFWPARIEGLPIPAASMVRTTFDAVCTPGTAMLLGLFEAGELWTSVALRRNREGLFDWIEGPDELRRDMGLLSGDFRRDYRHMMRTVEARLGKVSLGCFADAATFRRLEVDATPGAWAKAVAVRDVILSPVPPALAIPLGVDAGRAAFSALRSVLDRTQAWRYLNPIKEVVAPFVPDELLTEDGKSFDFARVFGFGPLELLRKLISRDR